jgi:dTDP-4-amino-4,6-dideoxygalactose transaminase
VVRVANRKRFQQYLLAHGVETDVHYPVPLHKQPCFREYSGLVLPVAERLADEVVSLPISPACTSIADAREISKIINGYHDDNC